MLADSVPSEDFIADSLPSQCILMWSRNEGLWSVSFLIRALILSWVLHPHDITGHGTTDWFQIGKGVRQGCILSPCLFNFYAEYSMRNPGLEEAQAGIKIARRNINNLSYADDTTLMAESEEELKSLLMKVKVETEKVGLKLNI